MKSIDLNLNPSLKKHVESLGLATAKDYVSWCKSNGFSQGYNKNDDSRKKELAHFRNLKVKEAVDKSKVRLQPTEKLIKDIASGRLTQSELNSNPKIRKLQEVYNQIPKDNQNSFLEYLLDIEKKSELLSTETVIADYGSQVGNTFIEALIKLFVLKAKWIRPIENWEPKSHNIYKQFLSLTRHFFSKYPIPTFLDSAWFSNKLVYQDWYLFLAGGGNLRKTNIPLEFTKKMAHCFLEAPSNYTIEKALRWGQIIGMGGTPQLVESVNETELGREFLNLDLWNPLINLFVINPMLDPYQFGPIMDYIKSQKFGVNAPQPNYCMKGKTADFLLQKTEEWHAKLAKERPRNYQEWKAIGIPGFIKEEGLAGRPNFKVWTIREILNSKDLHEEGRTQKHCVGSYTHSCVAQRTSIWSLRCLDQAGNNERLLTIEVNNSNKSIVQARGKCNQSPTAQSFGIMSEWAANTDLSINVYSRH
jgi:hypothetical protein